MDATDLCFTPATELARLIRDRAISPVEVTEAVLARIERLNPRLNAYCTVTAEARAGGRQAAEAAVVRWRGARAAPRRADLGQGPDQYEGRADSARLAPLGRQRAGRGRAGGRAHQAGGRDHPRQDEYAGVWLEGRQRQSALRAHL